MIRIIPDFLLRLPLKALSPHVSKLPGANLAFKRCLETCNLRLLSFEVARKCVKLAQLSCELAVSPPVSGKYVNCAKLKCTWMPWMQLANTAALQKYLASTASQKYLVITAL